jgi:hypothetical protein
VSAEAGETVAVVSHLRVCLDAWTPRIDLARSRDAVGTLPDSLASRSHVLLVEDNAPNQKFALLLLRKLGVRYCDVAANGRGARPRFTHSLRFDPHGLPDADMDGFEATRRIRDQERTIGSTLR